MMLRDMLEPRIQPHFFDLADLLYQAAEPMARPLSDAAQAITGALTAGGKLMVGGGPLAAHFASLCLDGFERERPPLAAWALDAGTAASRVQALGLPGDLLVIVDDAWPRSDWSAAVRAAHGREMSVVALTGAQAIWLEHLDDTDIAVPLPPERAARARELLLLALHALADAIDLQLMGEGESS